MFAAPALARPQACNTHDRVLTHLAKKYGEVPVAIGVTSTGGLIEVLTSSDGSTWTIIISSPNGTSCLVASGEGWRSMERAMDEPEA